MICLSRPGPAQIDDSLARVSLQPLSYAAVGATRDEVPPAGYVVDHRRTCLGRGEAVFRLACACLRRWEMFQLGWLAPCWPHTPLAPGSVVATLVYLAGTWWLNPCRIVYVEEASEQVPRFRFAYGTLRDHAEEGEERFTVEWLDDDSVWYDLYAFSRPRHWLARLGYPAVRWLQKRAGRQSMRAMSRTVRRLARQPMVGGAA
jgi:uncharacterized protein (UPF0548 family)